MLCRPMADVRALRSARTRSPSARSRCALRSMPPIGRHHCVLRSRRRPRARRLPMGRRPPAGRLSRRVVASLDCFLGSQSAGRASSGAHGSTPAAQRVESLPGLMQDVHLYSQTRLRHVRCAKWSCPAGLLGDALWRSSRKEKAAGPLHPAAFPKIVSDEATAQRSMPSSMLCTVSIAAWIPRPLAIPAML